MSYFFGPYISVAEKARKAQIEVQRLRNKGFDVHPIEAFKGPIAKTFWGKSWCENLEQYADYQNRIGRGRSYVRNGFICDLHIEKGVISAIVYGRASYNVRVSIKTLDEERWKAFCERCAGKIGSLVELLQGTFSKDIMQMACDPESGLFPSPDEIVLHCSCPDWAKLCKHVAAVLYAIGRRLDEEPDLFFTLRGVDASDLFAADISVPETGADATLDGERLADIFGIDLDGVEGIRGDTIVQQETAATTVSRELDPYELDPKEMTGEFVRSLRDHAGMTEQEFAKTLSVCLATVRRWEKTSGLLKLRADTFTALQSFQKKFCAARA
ncbi:MAG: SWIM zinc finger family protein [Desulfovibrionaceae bacterium]|nr:SWIM zinc finger family protein [Desulfovibrionaceae bacterium]